MNKLLDFNYKKSWAITKLNLRALRKTMLLCLIPAAVSVLSIIVQYVFLTRIFGVLKIEDSDYMGAGEMLLLVPIMCAVFLATTNFNKTMRLNAKKKDYFLSCLITITIIALSLALAMVAIYYVERLISNNAGENIFSLSLYGVFGFADNFLLVGFLQMFGFIFFWSMFVFILSSLQDNIIGWLLDIAIVACISVFSSIKFFRQNIWNPFFTATIFGHPVLQICFTIFVGLALYSLYLLIVRRKKI